MITSWNGNAFLILAPCETNPPITGSISLIFLSQRTRNAALWCFRLFLGWSSCWANSRVDLIIMPCDDAIVHHRLSARQCLGLVLHFIFTGVALVSVEQLECEIMLLCYHDCYHQSWSSIKFWVVWVMIWTMINKKYTTIIIRDCSALHGNYRQVSNIRRTLVDNKLVDHSDVVGASPVGAAPTASSVST